MKKLTKALLAIGAGAACVATGGLAAPAIGAAIGLTGTAAAHVVAGSGRKSQGEKGKVRRKRKWRR